MKYTPYPYQDHATRHAIEHPFCGLFLDMGLGKTVSTLTAFLELKKAGQVKTALVVAPLRVAGTVWDTEAQKWDHLNGLTFSKVLGTEKKRKEALAAKADIYLINRENVAWLAAQMQGFFPFDVLIIDELSSFKSAKSDRFKALKKMRPAAKRVIGLTGTPTPNGLLDLWAQMYLLDRGQRLGEKLGEYREKYFRIEKTFGPHVHKYGIRKGEELIGEDIYQREIYDKISDIVISMKSEDYLDLPELIERDQFINFTPDLLAKYERFEEEQVLALFGDGGEISVANAAALSNKLRQFCNGAVYDEEKNVHEVHSLKLDALEDIVAEAQGAPVLVFYEFQFDADRIMKRLKKYGVRQLKNDKDVAAWNRREVPVMIAHPASAGHGLNLQAGGNTMVFFGLNWSLELYQQALKRIHRQGQTDRVIMHRLLTSDTIEVEILNRLARKERGQAALMDAVKARIEKYTKHLAK